MKLIVLVLGLVVGALGSLGDGEKVVEVAPVLAPPREGKNHVTDRARQFPFLVVWSQDKAQHQPKSLSVNPEPVYVQKLEEQAHNRQRRHLLKKKKIVGWKYGGGGGYYGGGNYGGHGYGGRGGYGGGYGGGCYTCGGGGGGGQAYAQATAIAYGKR